MHQIRLRFFNSVDKIRAPTMFATRMFSWKVGDTIPVAFLKDQKPPVIKENAAYPEWVAELAKPLPSKAQLLNKYYDPAFDNKNFTSKEVMRLKRMITLSQIKENNRTANV